MALLKLSGLVTKISGKVGGSVLGTSASGSYIKQNSYGQNKNSLAQQKQKTQIYKVSQLWATLTAPQRALWSADAVNYPYVNRVGDTVYYNKYSLFLWCNQNLKVLGLSLLNSPGVYAAPVTPVLGTMFGTSGNIQQDYNTNSVNNSFVIMASAPSNNSLQPKLSTFRQMKIQNTTVVNGGINFWSEYIAIFGTPAIGQTIFCYFKVINKNTGAKAPQTIVKSVVYS